MTGRIDSVACSVSSPTAAFPATRRDSFARALDRAAALVEVSSSTRVGLDGRLDVRSALELQHAVYRRAEQLELASKVIDSGVSAVKTILQTRV